MQAGGEKKQTPLIGVFWGAFDPPTKAHIAIIQAALALPFIHHLLIIVNNHSYKDYSLPLQDRKDALIKALKDISPQRLTLMNQDDDHPMNYAALEKISSLPLCAIAGYDAYTKWASYSNSKERSNYHLIAVVPRGDEEAKLFDAHAFLLPIDQTLKHVSSTQHKQDSHFRK
jgi:nicotinic acid mononucleotide adenylyltransferase